MDQNLYTMRTVIESAAGMERATYRDLGAGDVDQIKQAVRDNSPMGSTITHKVIVQGPRAGLIG